jgi:hypothetical protein
MDWLVNLGHVVAIGLGCLFALLVLVLLYQICGIAAAFRKKRHS